MDGQTDVWIICGMLKSMCQWGLRTNTGLSFTTKLVEEPGYYTPSFSNIMMVVKSKWDWTVFFPQKNGCLCPRFPFLNKINFTPSHLLKSWLELLINTSMTGLWQLHFQSSSQSIKNESNPTYFRLLWPNGFPLGQTNFSAIPEEK